MTEGKTILERLRKIRTQQSEYDSIRKDRLEDEMKKLSKQLDGSGHIIEEDKEN